MWAATTKDKDYITLLPHLVARTRTLRASDREALLFVSPPGQSPPSTPSSFATSADDDTDRLLLAARKGRVTLGVSALDAMPRAPPAARGVLGALGALAGVNADVLRRELVGRREGLQTYLDGQVGRARAEVERQWDRGVLQVQGGAQSIMGWRPPRE